MLRDPPTLGVAVRLRLRAASGGIVGRADRRRDACIRSQKAKASAQVGGWREIDSFAREPATLRHVSDHYEKL